MVVCIAWWHSRLALRIVPAYDALNLELGCEETDMLVNRPGLWYIGP